jgi:hypothetical protein
MDSATIVIAIMVSLVCVVLPIMVFFIFRSGPVSKQVIMDLPQGSVRAYEEARGRFLRDHGSPTSKPVGMALASRGIFPPKVYRNGILANFGVIESHGPVLGWTTKGEGAIYRARLKFVPNDMISSVLPVSVRQHGPRFRPSELTGLQVETKDLQVGILPEPKDDGRFEEALKQSLGTKWQGMYNSYERLSSEERVGMDFALKGGPAATMMLEGQVYLPSMLRHGWAGGQRAEAPTAPVEWEPVADDASEWQEY